MTSNINLGLTNVSAETHPLTWRYTQAGKAVLDIKDYEALEGYAGMKKAMSMQPTDVQAEVKASNLRGRGGAGFPTGIKWSLIPMGPDAGQKYLVCNADEMEPGTFKDRFLMEELPHQLVEAMITAAYAIGASQVFLGRGEYILAGQRLNAAIEQAKAAGYIGENILGTGFNFELNVHLGAGRYICGEETALINCLEGRRANPRTKPPFPQQAGAWGKPTIVNNVETLMNIPAILNRGAEWFKGLSQGKSPDAGTKMYGISGKAKITGLWELPIGTTGRELLYTLGGGMADGYELTCWLPGGASTDFLMPEHLDLPMDYDTIMKAGSRMGTALIMVVDDKQNIISVVRNLEQFFARESCGWCTPCRDGIPWTVKILQSIEAGEGQEGDIDTLKQLTRFLGPGKTFCAHAPGAMEPLQSALKFFPETFAKGIKA